MTAVNATFGTFADGGDLVHTDIVVGLRNGVNTRFNYVGDPGIYLPLAGGTMSGAIDMDGNSVTGLPVPTLSSDAATKAYVDALTAPVGASGTFQRSNGTNWIASTSTIPDTYVLGDVIYASAANVLTALAGNTTTAKQYLSQTGSGVVSAAPSWATISGGDITGAALTRTDDTNVTLTLGGTPATSLLRAASLTLGWTGSLAVGRGGTGNTTFTAYSVICAGTTATGAFQNVSGVGTANQVLVSNGAAALPTWQSVPGLVPAALTEVNDTNVTLTLGGTPTTSLLQAVSLTLGWTGTLSGTRGGTGINNGSNTATFAGNLNFAAAFSTSGAFAVTQTYTGITNVTFPTSGTLATTSQLPTPAALTKTDDTNVTLTLGGTPATALLQAASLTLGWTGTLAVSRGGSGAGSFTAYSVLCGGTTSTSAFQSVASVGTSGQVLTSNGAGVLPTFQAVSGSGTVNSGTTNQLAYYAGNGTTVSGLSTITNSQNGVTMAMKGGSGGGDYTTTSASYTDVDGTNLAYTVTVPSGYKLQINTTFTVYNNGILNAVSVALTDSTSVLLEQVIVESSASSVQTGGSIPYVFPGDGASHTFKLRWKTSAGTAGMANGSSTNKPNMTFLLTPSN